MRFVKLCAGLSACLLAACSTTETAKFTPTLGQEAIVRDGVPALVSRQPGSVVLVKQASRERQAGSRPSYVIAVLNLTPQPVTLMFSNLAVAQVREGQRPRALKTHSYEQLVKEEKTRQIVGAILVGVAAGANSYSAAQAGHYSAGGTIHSPFGTSQFRVSGYDPTAAQIAQMNANLQNQAMISSAIETGQRNLNALEGSIIKDNTIFPGEWYGGQLVFDRPQDGAQTYRISVLAGSELHQVEVANVRQ